MPQADIRAFDVPSTTPPREQTHILLGMVPAGEFWAVATAEVSWSDDSEALYRRTVEVVLDVDGFDAEGNPADWDSGIGLGRQLADYQADGIHVLRRALATQNVFTVPSGGLILKLGLADQSNDVAHSSVTLLSFRLVVVEAKLH